MDTLCLRIIQPNFSAGTTTSQSDTRQRTHREDRRIGLFFLFRMHVTLYTKGGCISIMYLSQNSVCRPHGAKIQRSNQKIQRSNQKIQRSNQKIQRSNQKISRLKEATKRFFFSRFKEVTKKKFPCWHIVSLFCSPTSVLHLNSVTNPSPIFSSATLRNVLSFNFWRR